MIPFSCAGFASAQPSQGTAFIRSDFRPTITPAYIPAPQSSEDVLYGLAYYCHTVKTVTETEEKLVESYLERLFLAYFTATIPWTREYAMSRLERDKAAGWFWRRHVASLKGEVIDYLGDRFHDVMMASFHDNTPVFSSTLKDELRPLNKKARLFMPAPIELTYVGMLLFGAQNDAIMSHLFRHPIMMGAQCPGRDLCRVYENLKMFSNKCCAYDTQKHDASAALWVFRILRDLRKKALPPEYADDVNRYYDAVYCSWVAIGDAILQVDGQKSGQFLTASDNSLYECAMFILHAIRNGLTFEELQQQVLYYVMGDDIIYASRTDVFSPLRVASTFASQGVFLECDSQEFVDVMKTTFLGTVPMDYEFRGVHVLIPLYRKSKISNSLLWKKSKANELDMFAKLVSCATLLFADKVAFSELRRDILDWYREHANALVSTVESAKATTAYLRLLTSDLSLFVLHTGIELAR